MSPVSPALAENLAAEVVGHYQEAERVLLARISRNLAKGIDGPHWAEQKYAQLLGYQRQTEKLVADLAAKAKTGVNTAITTAYDRGGLSAVSDLAKLQPGVTPVEPLAGLRAVEAMAAETLGYVNATHPRILRSTMEAYRAAIEAGSKQAFVGSMERVAASEAARTIVAEQGTQVLLGTQTRRQATQAALDAFAKRGIVGFVSKSGTHSTLESYTETAMRTGCGQAAVQGHVDRLTANGLNLVIVSDAPRECPLCRPWEGKVLSIGGPYLGPVDSAFLAEGQTTYPTLDEARAARFQHVNCRHSVSAYQEGITRPMTDTADPEGYAATQKLRYLERNVRQSKRMEAAAMSPEALAKATQRKLDYQAKIRNLVSTTTAKRQPYRESLGVSKAQLAALKPTPVIPSGIQAEALDSWRWTSGAIREESTNVLQGRVGTSKNAQYAQALLKAVDESDPYKGTVYRGLANVYHDTSEGRALQVLGAEHDLPLSSFTLNRDVALKFTQGSDIANGIELRVTGEQGIKGLHLATDEDEFITYGRHRTKKVEYAADGHMIVHMEKVEF